MTIRQRVAAALRREPVDQIPFTIYPTMLPPGEDAERIYAMGLGLHVRIGLVKHTMPNVVTESVDYEENGMRYRRTTVKTPVGEVFATSHLGAAYGTQWYVDHYVKSPGDYKVVEYMIRDMVLEPDYNAFYTAKEQIGDRGYVTGNYGYSPLMEMRVNLLGIERFSMDMYDYPELFFSLYDTLQNKQREAFPIIADSPADFVIYCGNCSPETLGKRFQEYCLPCYNELGAMLHAKGKLLGCHLDANNKFWAGDVAASALDVIEAFSPDPDSDMSVADARVDWPSKVLWINFPSSLHLAQDDTIRRYTRRLLEESAPRNSFIVGVTEDIPENVWRTSMPAIAEELARGL